MRFHPVFFFFFQTLIRLGQQRTGEGTHVIDLAQKKNIGKFCRFAVGKELYTKGKGRQ
jgi:hypothetical protein